MGLGRLGHVWSRLSVVGFRQALSCMVSLVGVCEGGEGWVGLGRLGHLWSRLSVCEGGEGWGGLVMYNLASRSQTIQVTC